MLEIKDVSKNFKDSKVVDRLSFNVKEGEIVGLRGGKWCRKNYYIENDFNYVEAY